MKKNSVLGWGLWLVYSTAVLLSLIYIAVAAASGLGYDVYIGLIVAGGILLVALLVYLLAHGLPRGTRGKSENRVKSATAEGIALVVIVVGTLVWRFLALGQTPLSECYELAQVDSTEAFAPNVTNGALNLYLQLLHGVLWVFGNTGAAAYGLQLVLFIALLLVFYFGVRSLCGPAAALIAALLLGASPFLGERFLADTPDLLFCLVFFLAFTLTVSWWDKWNRYQVQRGLPAAFCRCLVTGLFIGLGIYMDAAAALLVVLLACVLIGGRKPAGAGATDFVYGFWNLRPVSFLLVLLFGTATCIGMLYLTGISSETWLAQYMQIFFAKPVWLDTSFCSPWEWEIVIVTGLLTLGVFTAWNRRGADERGLNARAVMVMCALVLMVLQCCGILTDAPVDSYLLLYLFLLIFAGMSVADLFAVSGQKAETLPEPEKEPEPVKESEPAPVKESEPAPVTFLESPLPLPKKPAHRVLDYDIEVADDDDYDIK